MKPCSDEASKNAFGNRVYNVEALLREALQTLKEREEVNLGKMCACVSWWGDKRAYPGGADGGVPERWQLEAVD